MKKIIIEDGTEVIRNHRYACDNEVSQVIVPGSVSEIGIGAFSGCAGLETVTLNEGLTRLRKDVFAGCSSLREINIPDSLQSIGEWAFRGCKSLKEIKIPENVKEICAESFLDCPDLTIAAEEGTYAADFAERTGIHLRKITEKE